MRSPRHSPEAQIEIGREILAARAKHTPWKILVRRYGYGPTRLYMLMRNAADNHEDKNAGAKHMM